MTSEHRVRQQPVRAQSGLSSSSEPLVLYRVVVPLALLVLYGVVQAFYLRPVSPEDGMTYFQKAAAFPDVALDHWSLRIGLLLPVRALQLVFGYSEVAYYGVPIVSAALLVLATYWLGWRLFSPAVGIAAAILLVLNSVFLEHASLLQPDVLAAALTTTALCTLATVAQRHMPNVGSSPRWTVGDHSLLVLVGLLLGWAYLVREFIVFVFPVVLIIFVIYHLPWMKITWVASSAALVFAGEVIVNLLVHDSAFARFTVSASHGGQRDYITDSRLDAVVRLPHALADTPGAFPVLAMLALLAVGLLIRQRSLWLVIVWFLAFWVPVTLGTGLIEPSFRFFIADKLRYWLPVVPAVLVGGVAVAHHAATWIVARASISGRVAAVLPGVAVCVLAVVVGAAGSKEDRDIGRYRTNRATQLVELRDWLTGAGADVDVLWTDSYTARAVPLYARTTFGDVVWKGKVRRLDHNLHFVDAADIDSGAVVLHRPGYHAFHRVLASGKRLVRWRHLPFPRWLRDPPPDWERVLARPDQSLVIYRVGVR